MSKLIRVLLIITLVGAIGISKSYADEKDNIDEDKQETIDKINQIRIEQDELEEEIKYIEQRVIDKEAMKDSEEDVNVIQVSFIEDMEASNFNDVGSIINEEVKILQQTKEELEVELEKLVIEEVRLEKSIGSYMSIGCWPVPGFNDISSPFGYRIHPITQENKLHKGIDIPANTGSDIVATDDGMVTFSGVQNGYGNVIEIQHFGGKSSKYAHNDENIVNVGDVVSKGQTIAKIGSTGMSTGPHVHFEVLFNGEVKNPIDMIEQ
ncbi:MAG: M23 family metallopeptidase [Paraclostridium sp.]